MQGDYNNKIEQEKIAYLGPVDPARGFDPAVS
jgi:hypothetical protein